MNTEYAVGHIRIRFESRARRRWFVALCFAALAAVDLACCLLNPKLNPSVSRMAATGAIAATSTWIICGCAILFFALWIVLTGLAGNGRARRDEREMHRREQACSRAYPILGYSIVATFWACFGVPNPITPLFPLALREFLVPLPSILLMTTLFLYVTLPPAILLWTEPDMESERPTN
jgi:small-conductance mechanosensitive channel